MLVYDVFLCLRCSVPNFVFLVQGMHQVATKRDTECFNKWDRKWCFEWKFFCVWSCMTQCWLQSGQTAAGERTQCHHCTLGVHHLQPFLEGLFCRQSLHEFVAVSPLLLRSLLLLFSALSTASEWCLPVSMWSSDNESPLPSDEDDNVSKCCAVLTNNCHHCIGQHLQHALTMWLVVLCLLLCCHPAAVWHFLLFCWPQQWSFWLICCSLWHFFIWIGCCSLSHCFVNGNVISGWFFLFFLLIVSFAFQTNPMTCGRRCVFVRWKCSLSPTSVLIVNPGTQVWMFLRHQSIAMCFVCMTPIDQTSSPNLHFVVKQMRFWHACCFDKVQCCPASRCFPSAESPPFLLQTHWLLTQWPNWLLSFVKLRGTEQSPCTCLCFNNWSNIKSHCSQTNPILSGRCLSFCWWHPPFLVLALIGDPGIQLLIVICKELNNHCVFVCALLIDCTLSPTCLWASFLFFFWVMAATWFSFVLSSFNVQTNNKKGLMVRQWFSFCQCSIFETAEQDCQFATTSKNQLFLSRVLSRRRSSLFSSFGFAFAFQKWTAWTFFIRTVVPSWTRGSAVFKQTMRSKTSLPSQAT